MGMEGLGGDVGVVGMEGLGVWWWSYQYRLYQMAR